MLHSFNDVIVQDDADAAAVSTGATAETGCLHLWWENTNYLADVSLCAPDTGHTGNMVTTAQCPMVHYCV